jgi:eukaryotic-like serine/threonine-protein kinase
MSPETGQRFGPYEILGRLGGGGMGLVFRAWDERLRRMVAVKLLKDDYKMPAMRERFLQEARTASGLSHPNICTIFDIGEQDGDPYLVMELLEGETLKDKIARRALSAEEIVRYSGEVADALTLAHEKGIVHRDIKPANIFLVNKSNGTRQTKMLDFGLAKINLEARGGWLSRSLDLTVAGSTVGTLAYMSPEQARGESLDARSDLFSLGIVMYEMATRQVPFKGTTSALLFVQLLERDPEPVRSWNDSIPRELERVILRLLMKDRRERYQTAEQLRAALEKIEERLGKAGRLKRISGAVPLVRVSEPTARPKPPMRKESGEHAALSVESGSGSGEMVIRPLRVTAREDHALRVVKACTVTTESKEVVVPAANGGQLNNASAADFLAPVVDAKPGSLRSRQPAADSMKNHSGTRWVELVTDETSVLGEESEDRVAAELSERRRIWKVAVAAGVIVAIVGGSFLLQRSGRLRPTVLRPDEALLLTVVQNKTGDSLLDGVVLEGLEMELRQSPMLKVRGDDAYQAGAQQIKNEGGEAAANMSARKVAQMIGAKAYLYGEISGGREEPYVISVDVLNTESNDKLSSVEETAGKQEEIPAAIERLAKTMRAEMGEAASTIEETSVGNEALVNVAALHAYALGEAAAQRGATADAIKAYRQAVTLDPRFVQAQIRLAWLYRAEKAEVAAANAASLAQDAARQASDRERRLAEFCYAMNASGDYADALAIIRQYAELYPNDSEGLVGLARVLRAEGHLVEALLAAQQAYGEDPYQADAYREAELAMIGLDRYDDALHLESQSQRLGVAPSGSSLAAAYLAGRNNIVAQEVGALQRGAPGYGRLVDYGLYLDNTEQLSTGTTVWKGSMGRELADTTGASGYMLAQGALDRALAEHCGEALMMIRALKDLAQGPVASFNAGMAAAMCGDPAFAERERNTLVQNYPQSTAVTQYYVPDLEAALELAAKNPSNALDVLARIEQYDQVSLTPYLRGLAHVAADDSSLAAADFQIVMAHRGAAFVLGSDVYPVAKIALARVSAMSAHATVDSAMMPVR